MIEPIKQHLIQNIKTEISKAQSKQENENEKYRKMQNEVENKGNAIDTFA